MPLCKRRTLTLEQHPGPLTLRRVSIMTRTEEAQCCMIRMSRSASESELSKFGLKKGDRTDATRYIGNWRGKSFCALGGARPLRSTVGQDYRRISFFSAEPVRGPIALAVRSGAIDANARNKHFVFPT